MDEFTIRVAGSLYSNADVLVNGRKGKFKSNGRGSYELTAQAAENTEIQIVRRHELLTPLWLLWGLFFFVISCFGIFDVPYSKKAALNCKINVKTNGGGVVQINPNLNKDGTAVVVEGADCEVTVLENSLEEKRIKKRLKALRIIKLVLWMALIAVIVVSVIM